MLEDRDDGCVAEYRASLAHQLRERADRLIDGKGCYSTRASIKQALNGGLTMASETANCRQSPQREQEHRSPFRRKHGLGRSCTATQ